MLSSGTSKATVSLFQTMRFDQQVCLKAYGNWFQSEGFVVFRRGPGGSPERQAELKEQRTEQRTRQNNNNTRGRARSHNKQQKNVAKHAKAKAKAVKARTAAAMATAAAEAQLQAATVDELKELCNARNQEVGGTKAELIARLV